SLPEAQDLEHVRTVAEKCQQIVDQASLRFVPRAQFLKWIKESGAMAAEAEDYLAQLTQRLHWPAVSREGSPAENAVDSGDHLPSLGQEATPDGLEGQALNNFWSQREAILSSGNDQGGNPDEAEK
ncbi:hypothetical protein L208DRAFT_1399273, partial [Tricholoma matsutake]